MDLDLKKPGVFRWLLSMCEDRRDCWALVEVYNLQKCHSSLLKRVYDTLSDGKNRCALPVYNVT